MKTQFQMNQSFYYLTPYNMPHRCRSFIEWLKNGGNELDHKKPGEELHYDIGVSRTKRSQVLNPNGYVVRSNAWDNRQPHLPRVNIPLQQREPYLSQDVGYPRRRLPGPKVFMSSSN